MWLYTKLNGGTFTHDDKNIFVNISDFGRTVKIQSFGVSTACESIKDFEVDSTENLVISVKLK